jgi:hypothetical protein
MDFACFHRWISSNSLSIHEPKIFHSESYLKGSNQAKDEKVKLAVLCVFQPLHLALGFSLIDCC